jgi:hypothetical protein
MSFLGKLTAALTAQNHPAMPKKAWWKENKSDEKYFGPVSALTAHLWLLLMESDDWVNETEQSTIENIWLIHLRDLVAHAEQIEESKVTIAIQQRYKIRDGWKWYTTLESAE